MVDGRFRPFSRVLRMGRPPLSLHDRHRSICIISVSQEVGGIEILVRWSTIYACRIVSRADIEVDLRQKMLREPPPPENGSNKRSVRVHYRGAGAYSQLDEIRPIATNGLSLTHPPFALPSVQRSTAFTHNQLPKSPRPVTPESRARQHKIPRQIPFLGSANEAPYPARSSNSAIEK